MSSVGQQMAHAGVVVPAAAWADVGVGSEDEPTQTGSESLDHAAILSLLPEEQGEGGQ